MYWNYTLWTLVFNGELIIRRVRWQTFDLKSVPWGMNAEWGATHWITGSVHTCICTHSFSKNCQFPNVLEAVYTLPAPQQESTDTPATTWWALTVWPAKQGQLHLITKFYLVCQNLSFQAREMAQWLSKWGNWNHPSMGTSVWIPRTTVNTEWAQLPTCNSSFRRKRQDLLSKH